MAGWIVLSTVMDFTTEEITNGKRERRWRKGVAFLMFLPIFLIACLGRARSDTVMYISIFKNFTTNWEELLHNLASAESGQGFQLFQFFIKKIFGNNVTAFRVGMALVHSVPLVLIFRKYSENYFMTLFLFVAGSYHVGWMMNGLRQFMAVTIIFAATPLLLEKKYMALIGVILLAATFHVSAILMLPVVFIVQGKAWNEKTLFYIAASLGVMYVFSNYIGVMDMMLEGTEFEGAVQTWQEMGDDGTNPIRVFVNALPMMLAFLGRNHIRYENDEMLNICVNMSVVTTGLYLISMVTSGVMMGRLPVYASLYNLILLPNLIPKMFTEESTRAIKLLMIGFYMLYYMVEVGF